MKFENDFFRLVKIEKEEERYRAGVEFLFPHHIYQGHFPGHPVVPGVCTLSVLREILSVIKGTKVRFKNIRECKFVSALIPEKGLQAEFEVEFCEDNVVKCVARSEERTVLKLKSVIESF